MDTTQLTWLALIYCGAVVFLSLLSVAAYGFDKRRAGAGGRRVPERSLHLIALLGGWPGAFAGQRWFRHKTQKTSFRVVFWLTIVAHFAIVGGAIYLMLKTAATAAV